MLAWNFWDCVAAFYILDTYPVVQLIWSTGYCASYQLRRRTNMSEYDVIESIVQFLHQLTILLVNSNIAFSCRR